MRTKKLMKAIVAIGLTVGTAVTAVAPASANSKVPSTAPKNIRLKLIDGVRDDGLRLCWGAVTGATTYYVYVNGSVMASTGSTNCFQFNPGTSRYLSRDGKLSQFQVSAVNRAGSGPVSKTGDIKLEYDPQFNLWQVPTQSVLSRCGWAIAATGASVLGVLASPMTFGIATGAAVAASLATAGATIQCMPYLAKYGC